jgi:hypothetical protein
VISTTDDRRPTTDNRQLLSVSHSRENMTITIGTTVKHAREVACQWVVEEAGGSPGFSGAYFAGSVNRLPAEATLPATSDVDITVVCCGPTLPDRLGIIAYRGVLLDVSYMLIDRLESPELILGDYHMACTFSVPNVISDPTGRLAELQAAVSRDFALRQWVYKRCEQARDKVLRYVESSTEPAPLHDQVLSWLFGTGITTHVLLLAGLKSPTVKRRYLAARELLEVYERLDFYETLLQALGCAHMSRARVEHHLAALTEAFNAARDVVRTPFHFASEISDIARPLSIGGSRDLIRHGFHREAVFWIAVTYSRCRKVFFHDAPEQMRDEFSPGYHDLLADLGVASPADLQRAAGRTKAILPRVWQVARAIIESNPEIRARG